MTTTEILPVTFTATIKLLPQDLLGCDGDIAQAVQNVVGSSGATVIDAAVDDPDAT